MDGERDIRPRPAKAKEAEWDLVASELVRRWKSIGYTVVAIDERTKRMSPIKKGLDDLDSDEYDLDAPTTLTIMVDHLREDGWTYADG